MKIENIKEEISNRCMLIKYTWRHKVAMYKLWAKNDTLVSLTRVILHDVDKLALYMFLGKHKTKDFHNKYARHHNCKTLLDYCEKYLDCACARYTKADKPMDAIETFEAYYASSLDVAKKIYALTNYK